MLVSGVYFNVQNPNWSVSYHIVQVQIVKKLMENYLAMVKKNIVDSVPKQPKKNGEGRWIELIEWTVSLGIHVFGVMNS